MKSVFINQHAISLGRRLVKDKMVFGAIVLLSVIAVLPLFLILGQLIIKGLPQISLDFFVKSSPSTMDAMLAAQSGESIPGGIANGIVGTLLMVVMAAVPAVILGVMCGIFLSEKRETWFAGVVRFLADLLQGTPSIVIGIITYMAVVVPLRGYSALAGSVALFVMMLPLIVRSTEETLNMLPNSLKESGLALGGSYSATIMSIMLPSAFGGISQGILLSISRIMGETAPLMLTALGSTTIQWDVMRPSSAVPLLIWEFYNDPNLQAMIWSASLFLLLLVLLFNFLAQKISNKWKIN